MAQLFTNVGISQLPGILGREKRGMANGIYSVLGTVLLFPF